ncbi:hypothetical protein ACO2Q3_22680 [Caulobacter sp. KR2-114]|uniref:hypothetical protein n=1 Tax=Caulobacter sp. KR2-114 TaxID=3400912 RepID=UPI003C0F27C3
MVELGWIGEGRARTLYDEGRAVVDAAVRGAAPFDNRWTTWRADPAWPDDWALVPAYQA